MPIKIRIALGSLVKLPKNDNNIYLLEVYNEINLIKYENKQANDGPF